ncbi:tubulin glycylase 3A-like [Adelges cooleyi]|uniref:tubulin glycylase 3A-like n=1 Tax=Adelges cooleyi TaxID=133065 RepID=UPI00217FE665|nr:tubulin glycylase 3A-like [Adelges cooleyi]
MDNQNKVDLQIDEVGETAIVEKPISTQNNNDKNLSQNQNIYSKVNEAKEHNIPTATVKHENYLVNIQPTNGIENEKPVEQVVKETKSNDSFSNRYQLNSKNYLKELHQALMKECKVHLLDCCALNITLNSDTLTSVTHNTMKAIKAQKIFSVLGYFPVIVQELKNRGWVEKYNPTKPPLNYFQYTKSPIYALNWIESPPLMTMTNVNDAIWDRLKSLQAWNILKNYRSDLVFVTRKRLFTWPNIHESTVVSQMTSHTFCSKNGLAHCLEPYRNKLSTVMFPRCHFVREKADWDKFMQDYFTTALVSTLKTIVEAIENRKLIFSKDGDVPYEMINFVEWRIYEYIIDQKTGFIDKKMWIFENQTEVWNEFMSNYWKLINNNANFRCEYSYQIEQDVYARCKYLLDCVDVYLSQNYIDGNTNTWIIKPTSNCSGHGIIMARDLDKIKEKIVINGDSRSSYILQKYIEKPLLVFSCKIDLRQWFLVTNMNPVTVWMYKEGYVRFCAKRFTLKDMHESIHLSNVRLQMKYRKKRDVGVPDECMWDYKELQKHLKKIGQDRVWDDLIFPGMSESVYTVMMATKSTSSYRDNTFQLFGADFVITDNFIPYLIEINSVPGLNPSTSTIANLTPMLLKDIVKVIVDYKENPDADTGLFTKVIPDTWERSHNEAKNKQRFEEKYGLSLESHFLNPLTVSNGTNTYGGPRSQWVENVAKKLTAIRLQSTMYNDTRRYVGPNRDFLLPLNQSPSTVVPENYSETYPNELNIDSDKLTKVITANAVVSTEPTVINDKPKWQREAILDNSILSPQEKIDLLKKMYMSYGRPQYESKGKPIRHKSRSKG